MPESFNYPNPMPTSFDEWRKAARMSHDIARDVPEHDIGDSPAGFVQVGLVYPGNLVITLHGFGEWSLVLGNQDWLSRDLSALEARLFEFYTAERFSEHRVDPAPAVSASVLSEVASELRNLGIIAGRLYRLYDEHEALNEVQPHGMAAHEGVGVLPMSLDEWQHTIFEVAEQWEALATKAGK